MAGRSEKYQSTLVSDLDLLLRHPGIWRADRGGSASGGALATGFLELDRALPAGGWPVGALTELLCERPGIGELRLVMPALARISREGRWVAWVAPPHIPYAPALAARGIDLSRLLLVKTRADSDALWAVEQALRSGSCGAVLAWPATVDERGLRRLQLAAETGRAWGLLFRAPGHARRHSPAALRMRLEPFSRGVVAQILKCRGRGPSGPLAIELDMDGEPGKESPEVARTASPADRCSPALG